jgi:hypothetical protein
VTSPERRNIDGYWVASVQVLGALQCKIGFHFHGTPAMLNELEFFRDSYADQRASFDEFQRYFEKAFGRPVSKSHGLGLSRQLHPEAGRAT